MAERFRLFKNRSFPRSTSGRQPATTRHKRAKLHLEQLEPRMLMDGAGFKHTDPPEDPDSIVGVAGIIANDDHRETRRGTLQLRIAPLSNDQLPEGSENLRIKSVSETRLGHTVTISEDGQRLIYNAGEEGLQTSDTFYYIVESDDGKLGKANVNLSLEKEIGKSGGNKPPRHTSNDRFSFFEDTVERRLNVLRNDRGFRNGEIVAVSLNYSYYSGPLEETPPSGAIRISPNGKALYYQSSRGFSGTEQFTYTVRNQDGSEASATVDITIDKPISALSRRDRYINQDFGTGKKISPILYKKLGTTPITPFVESIVAPEYVGTLTKTPDGNRLIYNPDPNFIGGFQAEYSVRYGPEDYQFVSGILYYNIQNTFLTVDNWFSVEPDSNESHLDVLANDPTWRRWHIDKQAVELSIVNTSPASNGGQLRIADNGKSLFYQPAVGFTGDETFTYEVLASNGVRDSATVTVHVADSIADPSGVDRFINEAELQQFLVDKAVANYGRQFGLYQNRYAPLPEGTYYPYAIYDTMSVESAVLFQGTDRDHSDTNTQVEGVDEADIVETDGQFVYTFTNGTLVIVDVSDPATAHPVSFTQFDGKFDLMYLQGERMTLLRNGSQYQGDAEVLVLDISDRSAPAILERTEIDGHIADSRAIGNRVHLVVKSSFHAPELGGEWIVEPIPPTQSESAIISHSNTDVVTGAVIAIDALYYVDRGEPGIWRNETLDQYIDRVRDSLIEKGLPSFHSYNAAGELIRSGLLTEATNVHKPVAGSDLLVSMLTIDIGDNAIGPLASATSFITDSNTEVFVSANSAYVFAYDPQAGVSNVYKMNFENDGSLPIVASGTVGGRLLNQFSADEHNGRLRIATTETQLTTLNLGRGRRRVQQRQFNNVLVLEQQGNELITIGEVTNLALTESIHSVRFMGDRAYVVTFRRIDPLFALDMSDPTNPTVEGALKIPGFSNYLHPVGNDYLIGIGRDANEITGRLGPLQITLFNVSDLSDPHVEDQLTFDDAQRVDSEAWQEHHAVSFFAESGVLTIPISWREQVEQESDGELRKQTVNRSAIWTFQVDVENPDGPSIEATGSVEHEAASYTPRPLSGGIITTGWWRGWTYDPGSPARRALRVGESLITVSNDYVKINDLHNPSIELAEVYLGQLAQDDFITIDEDSGTNILDVRANDRSDPGHEAPIIVNISQPNQGGLVTISNDGETLLFTPEQDFSGKLTFTYTTHDEVRGEETATVTLHVVNILDAPTAVDDSFSVEVDSNPIIFNVLANDLNPDAHSNHSLIPYWLGCDTTIHTINLGPISGLRITELGETNQQGYVELDDWGRIVYTPAPGFEGFETFTYTITNNYGLTDTGTVTIQVGSPTLQLTPQFLRSITEGIRSPHSKGIQLNGNHFRNEIVLSKVFDQWQQITPLENSEDYWSSNDELLASDQAFSFPDTVATPETENDFFTGLLSDFSAALIR